jgi:hypothetical protein
VHEAGVGRAEQPLAHRAEARLGAGTRLLGAFVAGQQRLEVEARELGAAVDHHGLRQALVPTDALAQDQHRGAIARRVEGEGDGEQPPRGGVGQKGRPGPTQGPPGARADQLDVQFGVVDVADLEGAVPVARRGQGQFPVERRRLGGGARPLALGHLLQARATVDGSGKGLVARHDEPLRFAGAHQGRIDRKAGLLLERLVVGGDERSRSCRLGSGSFRRRLPLWP